MEHFAHDGPAASCTEYPVQTQLGLKRTCIQEEHMHGPDIVERTKAVHVCGVRTENYLFSCFGSRCVQPCSGLKISALPLGQGLLQSGSQTYEDR